MREEQDALAMAYVETVNVSNNNHYCYKVVKCNRLLTRSFKLLTLFFKLFTLLPVTCTLCPGYTDTYDSTRPWSPTELFWRHKLSLTLGISVGMARAPTSS